MQSFGDRLGTQLSPKAPEADPTDIPFQEMATPDPSDALFALRAVQLGLAANTLETSSNVAEGTAEKLYARACAAMTRATLHSAHFALELRPVAHIDSVNLLVGQQIIALEVTPEQVEAVAPQAEDILESTGVHVIVESPDKLTPAQLKLLCDAEIAKVLLDAQSEAEAAQRELQTEIDGAAVVPALRIEELRCLERALRRMADGAGDEADKRQALMVARAYGLSVGPTPLKALRSFAGHVAHPWRHATPTV